VGEEVKRERTDGKGDQNTTKMRVRYGRGRRKVGAERTFARRLRRKIMKEKKRKGGGVRKSIS